MAKPRTWVGEAEVTLRVSIDGVKAKNEAQAMKLMEQIIQDVVGVNARVMKGYKGVFVMEESILHVEFEDVDEAEED